MIRSLFVLVTSLILLITLLIPAVTHAHKAVPFLPVNKTPPVNQQAQSGGDYAIHVRWDGPYPIDGVILPVFEALDARYMAANKEFTIEYWFKLPVGSIRNGEELFDHHRPSEEGFWSAFKNNHIWAGIDAQVGNDPAAIHLETGTGFNDGQWHHFALVRDLAASPDRLCLYLDGVSACYTSGSNPVNVDIRPAVNKNGNDNDNSPIYAIGSRTKGGDGVTATIDELRISDVARYRSNFTPTVAPFSLDSSTVMLFHFNEGSGNQTLGLSSTSGLALTGLLVKFWSEYGDTITPLDPNISAEANHLEQMWVDGRFGTTSGPPAVPSLTLTSPNGNNLWLTGSSHQISWTSSGEPPIADVSLSYSIDNFINSQTIVSSTPNTGIYTWTTPGTPSTAMRVRVASVVSPTIYDDSDTNFVLTDIIYPVYLPVILKD